MSALGYFLPSLAAVHSWAVVALFVGFGYGVWRAWREASQRWGR